MPLEQGLAAAEFAQNFFFGHGRWSKAFRVQVAAGRIKACVELREKSP